MYKIKSIYIGVDNRINYLVIDDFYNTIILNITEGVEENNKNLSLKNVEYIYKSEGEYQEKYELGKIIKVSLLSNVDLINKYTNKNISSPYLLEIEDENHKCLYIDVALNQTYTRNNHYKLVEYSNTKERLIFSDGNNINIFFTRIVLRICRKLKFIFDMQEDTF